MLPLGPICPDLWLPLDWQKNLDNHLTRFCTVPTLKVQECILRDKSSSQISSYSAPKKHESTEDQNMRLDGNVPERLKALTEPDQRHTYPSYIYRFSSQCPSPSSRPMLPVPQTPRQPGDYSRTWQHPMVPCISMTQKTWVLPTLLGKVASTYWFSYLS